MCNSHSILGHGTLDAFLLAPNEYINANSQLQATNLRNIVQNPDERIAILTKPSYPVLHRFVLKDRVPSAHLGLVSPSPVCYRLRRYQGCQKEVLPRLGVVWSGRGHASLGSPWYIRTDQEPWVDFAFHKIQKCQWIVDNAAAWRTYWNKATMVIYYGPLNIAPNETRPTVMRCSTLQSNNCAHSVVRREHCSSPFSDQSTTRDKNKILHALYA